MLADVLDCQLPAVHCCLPPAGAKLLSAQLYHKLCMKNFGQHSRDDSNDRDGQGQAVASVVRKAKQTVDRR